MPYPMVHFAISMKLFDRIDIAHRDEFLLGCISPDSIHMRPGANRAQKAKTHLDLIPFNAVPLHFDLLGYLKSFIERYGEEHRGFALGYTSHILTDLHWLNTMHLHFRDQLPLPITREDRQLLYNRERATIDRKLFQTVSWRQFVMERLSQAKGLDLHDRLLTREEIVGWRDQVISTLQSPTMSAEENLIITDRDVAWFIESSARWIERDFRLMHV